MTVGELIEKLKRCGNDREAIIVDIDDGWIELHHITGCVVTDTGEALITFDDKLEREGK